MAIVLMPLVGLVQQYVCLVGLVPQYVCDCAWRAKSFLVCVYSAFRYPSLVPGTRIKMTKNCARKGVVVGSKRIAALTVNRTQGLQIFSLTLYQLSYQSCYACCIASLKYSC